MDDMLEFARAVFEKTRLRMTRVLMEREFCVCELAEIFEISSSRMSQHLRILKRAGVVSERREGKWVYYAAVPAAIEDFDRRWRDYLRTDIEANPLLETETITLNSDKLKRLRERCREESNADPLKRI